MDKRSHLVTLAGDESVPARYLAGLLQWNNRSSPMTLVLHVMIMLALIFKVSSF